MSPAGSTPAWRRRSLGAVAASAVAFAGVARGHETAAAGDAPAVTLSAVVVAASIVGVVCGLAVVAANAPLRSESLAAFDGLVGVVLVFLGATYAASVAAATPALAAGGVVVGLAVAWVASHGHDRATRDHAAAVAVVSHRAVEGVALAAVYLAGSTVGLVGAALLAAHATVETVAVGAMYVPDGRRRAVVGILAVQAGFLGGVAAGYALAVAVPATPRVAVVAAGAGTLLAVGVDEILHARRPGATATRSR